MDVRIHAIYESSYLNIISAIFKDLGLPQLIDRLVPVDPQCQTRASDVVWLLILDILSGRQALVHLERWAHDIDLPKLIRPRLDPSWFNDDAIARHLGRLYEANIHQGENVPRSIFSLRENHANHILEWRAWPVTRASFFGQSYHRSKQKGVNSLVSSCVQRDEGSTLQANTMFTDDDC